MNHSKKATLLIKNARQLITMSGPVPRIGPQMNELALIENGGLAAAGDERGTDTISRKLHCY